MAKGWWVVWILALGALLFAASPTFGQNGSVTGKVTESNGGSPLPNATVQLAGSRLRVLTDEDGAFIMRRVPSGQQAIEISFLGYEGARLEVSLAPGETANLQVSLAPAAVELAEVVVYGEATRGQAKALQRQKTASTISSVVSEELFDRFPDRNAAETVRRLPGISVSQDQGEAEYVQIRGIDQEYNSLTVNGVRIPAPDGDDGIRSVGLDLINNNLLGEIEVVKALTPDMDADAVGGVVNFGLRRAPTGGVGRANIGFGLNGQSSDFETYGNQIADASIVLGERFADDRFGLLVDGAYYRTLRHSILKELEFDDEDGAIDDIIFAQHTNDYDVKRQRYGFSATSDYFATPASRLYLTGSYNVYLDDEVRRIAEYNVYDGEESHGGTASLDVATRTSFLAG
ncbi:MAG: TonB-dependent receptor plug domain-containing protein [Gemmatimonas sp.]|nr:TonB-dependent receptor plug domain-containing protein [Gemmatimonas sp.]